MPKLAASTATPSQEAVVKAAKTLQDATIANTLAAAQGHGPLPAKTAEQQDATMAKTLAAAQGHDPPPSRPATDENVQEVEAYFTKLAVWVQRMVEQAVKTKAPGLRTTDFEGKPPH